MRPWQGFYFTRLLSLKFCVFMGHLNQETEYRWSPFDQKDLLTKHSSSWERAYTARIERNPIKNPTSKQLKRTGPNLGDSIDSWSPIFWGQSPERKQALRRAISQKKDQRFDFTAGTKSSFGRWFFHSQFVVWLAQAKIMIDSVLDSLGSQCN